MLFRTIDDSLSLALAMPYYSDSLFQLTDANREFLSEWLGWLHLTREPSDTHAYLSDQLQRFARHEALILAVLWQGEPIGMTGFHEIDVERKQASIGYWLDRGHNGRGIMTRSVQELIDLGRVYYGIERIEIRCATGNDRSRAIPERLGFIQEGTLRHAERIGGRWIDHALYARSFASESPRES